MTDSLTVTNKRKRIPFVFILLWFGAFCLNLKNVFTNFDTDTAYAVATSYRHIIGDRMFSMMWEPHQTSSFINDLFLLIFYKITGSFEGCVIFLQFSGLVVWTLAAIFLVKIFSRHVSFISANLMGIIFYVGHPKNTVMMEYSNMIILFSALMLAILLEYFSNQERRWLLFVSALLLCLEVLSYPSAVICYLALILCLIIFSNKKIQDALIVSGGCVGAGLTYIAIFSVKVGFGNWPQIISHIIGGDNTHGTNVYTPWSYSREAILGLVWVALVAAFGYIIYLLSIKLFKTDTKKAKSIAKTVAIIVLIISDLSLLVIMDGIPGNGANGWLFAPGILLLLIMLGGGARIKEATGANRVVLLCGILISCTSMIAVLMLTNLTLITVFSYCVIGAMAGIPTLLSKGFWGESLEFGRFHGTNMIWGICLCLILHGGCIISDYATAGTLLPGIENVVRSGPAKGIMCGYMGYYLTNASIEAFSQNVNKGEAILVVQENIVNSLNYMYMDSQVSHFSTISTTTYNDKLEEYWELYPEKQPVVIVVDCWFDNLRIDSDSWIMHYIEDNYELSGTSDYWWFYRKKQK